MKIQVGDLIRNAVAKQNLKSITQLGKELDVSRITVNTILKKDEMELKYVIAFGEALGIDFLEQTKPPPSLKSVLNEPGETYRTRNEDLKNEVDELRIKVIQLYDENAELRRELEALRNRTKRKTT